MRFSRIPQKELAEAALVKGTLREYLTELEQQNPIEEPTHQQALVSTTDPDSTYATKESRAAELRYFNNYLIDNQSCMIVGVQATAARLSQESAAAREMITRSAERRGRFPQSVAADTTYGNGELLAWLEERNITPYIRVPCPRTGATTGARAGDRSGFRGRATPTPESRSTLSGIEEPDRTAEGALAENEARSYAQNLKRLARFLRMESLQGHDHIQDRVFRQPPLLSTSILPTAYLLVSV